MISSTSPIFTEGDVNSQIAFIEDYPTTTEYDVNKLYVGGTRWVFEQQLKRVGWSRDKIWLTSLFKEPSRDASKFYEDKQKTLLREAYGDYVSRLAAQLDSLPNLKIIVPLGYASLYQLTGVQGIGNWRGSILPVQPDFGAQRYKDWKVIGTYSPHALNITYNLRVFVNSDLARVKRELSIPGINRPVRNRVIAPTFRQAVDYLQRMLRAKSRLAVDIEATENQMTCISFASSPKEAICIPYYHTNGDVYWKDIDQFRVIDTLVRTILEDAEIPKILQNGMFDFMFLGRLGYKPKSLSFDTLYASHCLYCELPKDLGTLTSLYTDEPFYKFERTAAKKEFDSTIKPTMSMVKKTKAEALKLAKKRATKLKSYTKTVSLKATEARLKKIEEYKAFLEESFLTIKNQMASIRNVNTALKTKIATFEQDSDRRYWSYNDTDSLVTFEIADKQMEELGAQGLVDFYQKYYIDMFPLALDMSVRGIKIDTVKRAALASRIESGLTVLREELYEIVGYQFNTASPPQMAEVLYERLGLPPITKKGRVTTDAGALETLALKTNHPALGVIVDIRKLEKLQSTYVQSNLENGRMASTMNIAATVTGRWSSSSTFWGTGGNLQNIPSGKTELSDRVIEILGGTKNAVKEFFVPSTPDHMFIEVDLSNADTWFTAFRAKDHILMDALLKGDDTHEIVWSICKQLSREDIKAMKERDKVQYKSVRNDHKRVGHGFNYGMSVRKMAAILRLPVSTVQAMFDRLASSRPAIPAYHRWVEEEIMFKHKLVNAWGRPRIFFDRIPYTMIGNKRVAAPDEVYRSGYAHIPQSSVADTIGHAALRLQDLLYKAFPALKAIQYDYHKTPDVRIALQVHDSLLVECKKSLRDQVIKLIWEAFDFKMCPWGDEFQIPWEYAIGDSWGTVKEVEVVDGVLNNA